MTKNAVILAAGRGSRLERRTDACAKCLVPVSGRPIIEYVLTSLAKAGVPKGILVLGHHGEQVERALGSGQQFGLELQYVWNREPERGNARSLWSALPLVAGEPFLLAMGDHLCSASLLRAFLDQVNGGCALAIDRSDLGPDRIAEATKVATSGGCAVEIGKQLERWDAVDTGISHWTAGALWALAGDPPEGELASLMACLARSEGGLRVSDVTGHFWLDIDTEGDLLLAERLLQSNDRLLD